ncbi:protein suppressor of underreplication [Anastrepha ludens]|uniref:protein suppressor of underreplication n=1 Tax=Anastrepha ludens TaxID=28586 RepID=UPI0023B16502|nr:protein suppressor of underreplication [Anastrepha ludens]
MYHFLATCAPEPLKLSERVQIPGHIRQYLKDFQVDTLRFLHRHLANRDFCILNDESGLGKCVATAVYLGAIAKNNKCLIVVQNDDELVAGWQFHFDVLTKLSVGVLGPNMSSLDPLPNVIIAKWATLRSVFDGNKYNFDYIIIDNRGQMMSNNFCMSMLLSNYERKVNLLISSVDVTSDLKLLHNSLRLGGHLDHQYEQFKFFEAKYKLPEFKDVLNKTADLEQYFLKREMISDYCKDVRLRRYIHQFEDQLPLVDAERYRISLELWHTISSSNSSQKSNDNSNNLNANSETATEELFNQAQALDREICGIVESRQSHGVDLQNNETSEDADNMSPLLIDSESCSSGEAEEVVEVPNHQAIMAQSTRTEPDVYEFVDLSNEQGSEEYIRTENSERLHITIKSTEWQSNSRSLTKKGNNQKTSVIQEEQGIENSKDLEENGVSGKKTNPQCCKETLEKKTIDERKEEYKDSTLKVKTNVNINDNKNASSSKRHIKTKYEKKLDEVAKKQKSVDMQSNSDGVKLIKRGGLKQGENNSKETSKKLRSTDNDRDAMKTKRQALDQAKEINKKACKKPKTTDKEANPLKETTFSAAKRDSLHEATQHFNASIEKRKTDQEKNAEIKIKATKSTKNISEISPRRLRHARDKADIHNDKCSVMSDKAAASKSVSATTPKKNSSKYDVVGRTKSSSNSTKYDTEKRNRKDDPKNKPCVEVPTIRTSRFTRSMQRVTRSRRKYMTEPLTLVGSPRRRNGRGALTNNCDRVATKDKQEDVGKSAEANKANSSKKNKNSNMEFENDVRKEPRKNEAKDSKRQKTLATSEEIAKVTDLAILPCSDTTEDMQCGQKIIADTHSDNGFLRPPTPIRAIRNSEPKQFLPTPSSFTESDVVFVPPPDAPNKTQQIVVLSSSTDEGSLSSQQFVQSRRTRALKQKKSVKRLTTDRERLAELSSTPTFGELLAKQRIHRKSPDIFSASTDLGLTCTQPVAADGLEEAETFQGFKIFGSEVKQMQQQHALNSSGKQSKSKQVLSRGRSCLNILENMFEPPNTEATDKAQRKQTKNPQQSSKKSPDDKLVKRTTRGSQPVVPSLPNTVSVTQLQQTQNNNKHKQTQSNNTANQMISGPMVDEEIFEITNNEAFGSMMRINANGEISPVQTTRSQQTTQHNKITNYLIGTSQLTPTEATLEERTPSKRAQMQLSGTVARRSPKTRSTQSTKLTKWFQKNGATLNAAHSNAEQNEMRSRKHTRSAIAKRLKRRCLELSFSK